MSTIDTPRPLAFRREFPQDPIQNASRLGLLPLYSTHSTFELTSSNPSVSDLKQDPITTTTTTTTVKPTQPHPNFSLDHLKPSLLILCLSCKKSTAWFSPITPPSQPLLDSQVEDHHSTASSTSSKILNTHSSVSSLNNSISNQSITLPSSSSQDQTKSLHTPHQAHSTFLGQIHQSTCLPLSPSDSQDHLTAPTWISGQIHGICSECQSASQSDSRSPQLESSANVLSHPSKPHPVSFFSDITPLSASSCSSDSFPSSTSIPLDFDDGEDSQSLASSPSSAQVISVASVKPFRLSFPEVISMRQPNLKTPPELPQLHHPDRSRHSPDHLIKLDLPPRRKARKGTSPTGTLRVAVTESRTSGTTGQDGDQISDIQRPPSRSASRLQRPATAVALTPESHSLVRQNSSHGLLGRFMSNPLKEFKRRPNTATGTSTQGSFTQSVPVKAPSPTMEELRSPISNPRPITPTSRPTQPRTFASDPSLAGFQRPATATTPIQPRFTNAPASGIRRPATGMGHRAPDFFPTQSSGPSTFPNSTTPHDFSYIPSWTHVDQKQSMPKLQPVDPPPRTVSRSVPSTPMNGKFKSHGSSSPSDEMGQRGMKNPIQAHVWVTILGKSLL
ncbi:hypothetical protein DFH28DRAFT_881312 [Melampsora americana]|nr:hypothetical protein DFH28DRAFT_881312 [Melampsora americana]